MTVRRPNFFHGHGRPAARLARAAAGDGGSEETPPDSPAEPLPAPAALPGQRRPWSIFHGGPTWPARRLPDDPK